MSQSRLLHMLNLANVPRWSVVPVTRPQSVAEHSFNVAAIALEICRRMNLPGLPSSTVIEYHVILWALVHDGPEAVTGDLPSTVKDDEGLRNVLVAVEARECPWHLEIYRRMHPQEIAIVKIADKIESVIYASKWTVPDGRDYVKRDLDVLRERVRDARSRFGWNGLPDIVRDIMRVTGLGWLQLGREWVPEPASEPAESARATDQIPLPLPTESR
jgi:5'-deoxynucleotidase YfbR-like HD superfamily hydrolase